MRTIAEHVGNCLGDHCKFETCVLTAAVHFTKSAELVLQPASSDPRNRTRDNRGRSVNESIRTRFATKKNVSQKKMIAKTRFARLCTKENVCLNAFASTSVL